MLNPPFRSPRKKVGGLYHFGRMLDKIRLHVEDALPEEYKPNFGHAYGLDGSCCGFLNVEHAHLVEQVRDSGGTDDELLAWCFNRGDFRPNTIQIHIWNEFARKFGYDDLASRLLAKVKTNDGLADREDIATTFDLIDFREGRAAEE
jgi:gluconokinase